MKRLLASIFALALSLSPAWAQFNGTSGIYALNHMTFGVMAFPAPTIITPGTGYAVNDTITVDCNDITTPLTTKPIFIVTAATAGVPTTVALSNPGYATALPSTGLAGGANGVCDFTQLSTSGSGTGAIIHAAFGFNAATINGSNSGTAPLSPVSFGAKCDGITNNPTEDAAIHAWAASAKRFSTLVVPGRCLFQTPIIFPSVSDVTIMGTGHPSELIYAGASTTVDAITIGPGFPTCLTGWSIRDLWIMSNTVMTAGTGLKLNYICQANILDVDVGGGIGGNTNWWDAIWYNGGNQIYVRAYAYEGSNTGEVATGYDTTNGLLDLLQLQGIISHSGIGLHIAGNMSAMSIDQTDILLNGENVRISQDRIAAANFGIWMGPAVFIDETAKTQYPSASHVGLHISDRGNAQFSTLHLEGTWVSGAFAQCILMDNSTSYYIQWSNGQSHVCDQDSVGLAGIQNDSAFGRIQMTGVRFYQPFTSTLPYISQVGGSTYLTAMTLSAVRFEANAATTPPNTFILGLWNGNYTDDSGNVVTSTIGSWTQSAIGKINLTSSIGNSFFEAGPSASAIIGAGHTNANCALWLQATAGFPGPADGTAGSCTFSLGSSGAPFNAVNSTLYQSGALSGFSGTKTAGACVLTITGGIITNVTGC